MLSEIFLKFGRNEISNAIMIILMQLDKPIQAFFSSNDMIYKIRITTRNWQDNGWISKDYALWGQTGPERLVPIWV